MAELTVAQKKAIALAKAKILAQKSKAERQGISDFYKEQQKPIGTAEDVARNVVPSVIRGGVGLLSLPRAVDDLIDKGVRSGVGWLGDRLGGEAVGLDSKSLQETQNQSFLPSYEDLSERADQNWKAITGSHMPQPATPVAEITDKIGQFYGGGLGGRASTAVRMGVASEVAGDTAEAIDPSLRPYAETGATLAVGLRDASKASRPSGPDQKMTRIERRAAAKKLGVHPESVKNVGKAVATEKPTLRPGEMLLDSSRPLRDQAEVLATRGGPATNIVSEAVEGRTVQAPHRIKKTIDEVVGPEVNFPDIVERATAKLKTRAKPFYDEAYETPLNYIEGSGAQLLTYIPQIPPSALKRANELMKIEGVRSRHVDYVVRPDGTVSMKRLPDVRQWDYIKRGIDDIVRSEAERGAAGMSQYGRALSKMKEEILAILDQAAPAYGKARKIFTSDLDMKRALEEGRTAFSKGADNIPAELEKTLLGMSSAERQAFTIGARQQIADIMGEATNPAGATERAFKSIYGKERLKMLLGEKRAKKIIDTLEREERWQGTKNRITGNSATARRTSARSDVPNPAQDSRFFEEVGKKTLYGAVSEGVLRLADRVSNNAFRNRAETINKGMAELLTSTGAKRDQVLEVLRRMSIDKSIPRNKREVLRALIRQVGPSAGGLNAQLNAPRPQ